MNTETAALPPPDPRDKADAVRAEWERWKAEKRKRKRRKREQARQELQQMAAGETTLATRAAAVQDRSRYYAGLR